MSRPEKIVYFMRPVGAQGPVKIGCSQMPARRLRTLEIWSPVLLEIVTSAPGDHRDESILHQMFGDQRRHGEWFEYSDRLGEVISFVQRTGNLPPLDYSLSPYAKGRGKSAMPRRAPKWHRDKSAATKRVSSAERRAFGYGQVVRPEEVCAVIARYQGFDQIPPTDEELAILNAYVDRLNQLPKAPRNYAAFTQWHNARLAGQVA